jgi:hypothetical protein
MRNSMEERVEACKAQIGNNMLKREKREATARAEKAMSSLKKVVDKLQSQKCPGFKVGAVSMAA